MVLVSQSVNHTWSWQRWWLLRKLWKWPEHCYKQYNFLQLQYPEWLTNLFQAIQQRLHHGKVPCLCALVKAFSLTEADASVLLKDPTGSTQPCSWIGFLCSSLSLEHFKNQGWYHSRGLLCVNYTSINFSGEIHGTLHRKVLENYQTELAPGAGLILKHVSIKIITRVPGTLSTL